MATLLIITALVVEWHPLETLEQGMYDLRAGLRPKPASSPIVLVAIDDESLKRIGPWPWPRSSIALAINRIHGDGAKVIGLDILYSRKDMNQGLDEIRHILRKIKDRPASQKQGHLDQVFADLEEVERRLDNDAALSSSLAEAQNVVLPLSFRFGETGGNRKSIEDYLRRNSLELAGRDVPRAGGVSSPVPDFAEKALALGHINHIADGNGTVRGAHLFISYANRLFPSFALQLAVKYRGLDIKDVRPGNSGVTIGDTTIPTDTKYKMLVRFADHGHFKSYSFVDLADNKVPAGAFKDRIVLVGLAAPGLKIPGGRNIADLDFNANVINAVLGKDFIARPAWALSAEAGVLVLFGILISVVVPRYGTSAGAAIMLGFMLMWLSVSSFFFLAFDYWIKVSYHMTLLGTGFMVLLARRYFPGHKPPESVEAGTGAEIIETDALKLIAGVRTDSGLVRTTNEDNFCIDKEICLLAVADGVGGQASGEVASRMAVEAIRNYIRRDNGAGEEYPEAAHRLGAAVKYANEQICGVSQGHSLLQKMGTTVAAALLQGNRLSIVHVGDSRVYLVRARHIEQLTEDHNLKKPDMRHILTRALGITPEVELDINELSLSDGDIVVLCTDGLNTMVSDRDILSAVASVRDPFAACTRLVQLANKNGGKDNTTVIVAYVYKKR